MEAESIARHLRCPTGEDGTLVAKAMNDTNRALNLRCIEDLELESNARVLEIGPGNGSFVNDLINTASGVTYTGLDWSADMVREACQINSHLVREKRAQFLPGSSQNLPFDRHRFDYVLTIHTLYFWQNPIEHLTEIRRVLKPSGRLCMAFGIKAFMQALPFVEHGFTLYDKDTVEALLNQAGLDIVTSFQHQERGTSNAGDIVDKVVEVVICEAG